MSTRPLGGSTCVESNYIYYELCRYPTCVYVFFNTQGARRGIHCLFHLLDAILWTQFHNGFLWLQLFGSTNCHLDLFMARLHVFDTQSDHLYGETK